MLFVRFITIDLKFKRYIDLSIDLNFVNIQVYEFVNSSDAEKGADN